MSFSGYAVSRIDYKSILLDMVSLAVVYFVPALSHAFSLPLYFAEPMRIMVILAMAHTRKSNAYLLALTLPFFSFLISAHPSLLKSLLITAELLLNVWLFYALSHKFRNPFAAMFSAIIMSKITYYLLKFSLISLALMETGLFSTPIWIQLVSTLIFSSYIFLVLKRSKS